MQRKIILVMARYYFPGYKSGGPVRSLFNLVSQLGDDFDFRIITSDRDILDKEPYPDVISNTWNQVGKAQVYYLPPQKKSIQTLARLMSNTPYDILYLNSFFDPIFTLWPLLLRRIGIFYVPKSILLATRGELSLGALRLKRWKKKPFVWLAGAIGLYSDLTWHASSVHEAENIKDFLDYSANKNKNKNVIKIAIAVASDMPSSFCNSNQTIFESARRGGQPLRLVFLSRIVPMKNLDFALRVLSKVTVPVNFHIYGPIEDKAYWKICNTLITDLPHNVFVKYEKELDHAEVSKVLEMHDLFFLPTRGENYGHVIMESLSVGTPVLISDTTPWRNLEQAGVGWELPLENEQIFADKINYAFQISNDAYRRWRDNVRLYAHAYAANPKIINSNRNLFLDVLEK